MKPLITMPMLAASIQFAIRDDPKNWVSIPPISNSKPIPGVLHKKNSHFFYVRSGFGHHVMTIRELTAWYDLRQCDLIKPTDRIANSNDHAAAVDLASIKLVSVNGQQLDHIPVPVPMRKSGRGMERFFDVMAWHPDGKTDQTWRLGWRCSYDDLCEIWECEIIANAALSILFETVYANEMEIRAKIIRHLWGEFRRVLSAPMFAMDAKGHVQRVRRW